MTGAATPSDAGLPQLAADARAHVAALLTEGDEADEQRRRGHRGLMAMVKAAVVSGVHSAAPTPSEVTGAARWLSELEELQTATGLFSSGDNLASPPDSAFTITDAALVLRVLRTAGPGAWPDDLGERLERMLRRAMPALIVGGVHTPNHRWELAGALAGAGELLGAGIGEQAIERAQEWLAEGVDIDADGLYSERSAIYAAHVSNPSLLALADVLGRSDLLELVHRNLHAQLDLTAPGGEVETVHSRRQDQKYGVFPLGSFAGQFARFAVSCARCRAATAWALTLPGVDPVDVLAHAMLDDEVGAGLLAAASEKGGPGRAAEIARAVGESTATVRWFGGVRLLRRTRGRDWATVYGGSDVPVARRIASGLACNPTFLRLALGRVEVSSVRLSRDFFGLGPFRAASVEYDSIYPDRLVMREELAAGYYQPLPEQLRQSNGAYPLEFEGRFAAAMAFGERSVDLLPLRTSVTVELTDEGAELTVTTDGPVAAHALEIGLRDVPDVAGAAPLGDGRFHLGDDEATVTVAGATLRVDLDGATGTAPAPHYHPGEAYSFLDGTDAVGGTRLYATWNSPGSVTVRLRRA
ncbi:hypothetical protein [Agromyces albus]|uniref:Heparinase n=1 Tax=Agromyces albus TaxID=205332 RepID=A0A4Q2KUP7_9MICO|nr:hypothetical protein [Agromyces albus]RXZ69275.1 hypothetical protein ESP51_12395 [Agromyces albus]